MQRFILRTITVMSVMCLCYLTPSKIIANSSEYGPEMDPVISEESENVSLTCPPPITIDCDETGIYLTYAEFVVNGGSVNLPDGCEVDSFSFVMDTQISQNGCAFVYFREYFISETCGNTFTCNQIVMLVDDDNPVILNCPSDTILMVSSAPCTVDFTVPDVETSDGCSTVTVTDDAPTDFPIGMTVVTITATDDCGNFSMCTFTVTVENTNTLTVTCPAPIDDNSVCDISGIPPYVDFAAFMAAGGSAIGDCSTTFKIDSVSNEQLGGSCPKTVNRTYYVSDDAGNQGSCTQVITIDDDTDPSFTVPPDFVDVECTMALDTSITGSPSSVMDNCDPNPTVTFSDSPIVAGTCVGEYSFTRTWTVTDECDNDIEDTQEISVVDTTPPTAICKDTVTLYLDSLGNADVTPADLDNGSSDSCSTVTFDADMSFVGCNQVNILTSVMLEVSDACGNMAECEVLVMVLDTFPLILVSPDNDTISCIGDLEPAFTNYNDYELIGGGSVNDNCPAGNTLSLIDSDTTGLCPSVVTRIYEYEDFAGNTDTALHTILVIDDESPMITSCPADISISELDICDTLLVFGLPVASDNCGEVTITNNYTNDTSSMATFSGGVTEILFTITDACGNSDTCSTTVTLDTEPKITCPPLGIIDSEEDLPTYPTLQDFITAGGMVNAFCAIDSTTFVYTNTFAINADSCTATITENITVSDTLGNPIVVDKMSTATDTLNPEISFCFDQFLPLIHETCEFDTTFILPTVTDNFEVDTTYFSVGEFILDTADVVFYAQDLCGNIDSCEFELIVYDPTSPDIELDDITIMCDTMGAAPIYTTIDEFLIGPGALIYDCRLDSLSFTHVSDVTDMDGNTVRTYSVEDLTGNIGTTIQVITTMDSTAPEITMCTSDISVNAETDACGATITVPPPTYMDNCGGTITLTNDYNGTSSADGFYLVDVTTVIWTIEDENGLTDTCSFTVEVMDVTIPEISCLPDTTIMCSIDNYPSLATIPDFISAGGEASDNCELLGINAQTIENSSTSYSRIYTVTDANGLENSCTQDIEIIDTIAPELTCVPFIIETTEINTCDKFINIAIPEFTDNCDTSNVVITNSLTGASDPSGIYSDTTEITWYAEDAFGNMDSCTYNIIVMDGTGPVVADPDTTMIMCEDMLNGVDTFMIVQDIIDAGGDASDNCGIEFINLISQTEIGIDTIERVYSIIDSTGNTSSLTHIIVIDDTTPPTFTAPVDVTIECDDDILDLAITGTVDSTMFADNCMDIDTLVFLDITDPGVCPFVNEVARIWILTDNSGNEARDTQYISTIDTIAPDFDSIPAALSDIDCDDDFPPMEVITVTDDCTKTLVLMDTLPFIVNVCAGYDVTYRWIAVDGCQNRDTTTQTFSVNPDTTAPELVSLNNMTVESESDICGIRVDSVPGPIFEEDCSTFVMTRNYSDTIYHVGVNNVEWTASNECGIDSTVTQVVIVEDNILPIALCKNATVGITANPQNYVFTSSFVDTASDNCGVDSIFVRRLTAACGDPNNNIFGDSILICCEDVGNIVDVEIRIVDDSGNENFCDATLQVDDNKAPLVLEQLPDIVISCSYVFDTLDMDVFGSFTSDPDGREDIIIEDTLYASQDSIAGIDGLVSDECTVTITDTTIVNLDQCSNGYIKRVFTFTDPSGNSSVSEQIIVIQDVSPFNENGTDIIWPEDFSWDQCASPAPDTSISGSVSFLNLDKCALVGASYKDQLFNFPTNVCPKILRNWKVIDWCQYDENQDPNPGLWTYKQFIFIENVVAPTITSGCTDTLICAPYNECSALVSLGVEAEDDCVEDSQYMSYAYSININSDTNTGNDISGDSSSFSLVFESGIHEVTWTVTDRCGNATSCSFVLTLKECKAPTAVCLVGLAIVLDQSGQIDLWASDVNQSSNDNCTEDEDLIFSFSSDVNDFGKTFDCDDLDTSQYIEMWVTDLEGNQSFCSTFVDVQDNNGYCSSIIDDNDQSSLQGKIATETNEAIPEAMVSIFGAEMDDDFMTADNGEYSFGDINNQNDYQIKVDRDKDDTEGVSTLDLVKIQRHILGLELLDSPYKLIAADVTNNEKITASDLVALRKLILGIDESFPDNQSWRFVSIDAEMDDMNNPWPFSEDLILGSLPIEELEADFIGVKIGDVNNSVDNVMGEAAIENRSSKTFGIVTRDQRVLRDSDVLVDFISNSNVELEALQMTIEWDKESMNLIDFIPVGLQIEDAFVNMSLLNEGKLTIAWTSIESKMLSSGTPIFQLVFEGNYSFNLSENLKITSEITEALVYDMNDVEYNVELQFIEGQSEGLMLVQNKPNPFAFETVVEFTIPEDMEVTFKVFNGAGSLIFKQTKYYEGGLNSFKLSDELGDHTGLLFLKMETAEFSDVKRMIRIE
jgi:hypothetical protein